MHDEFPLPRTHWWPLWPESEWSMTQMEFRSFGRTDLKVSAIGFGSWPMAGSTYGGVDEDSATAAVHRALDVGVNCFDTAPVYGLGESEQLLGRALGPLRGDVILVSKCGITLPAESTGAVRDNSASAILRDVDLSLQRLGTDYLDVVLMHWPESTTPFEESMTALDGLVTSGKTRFVGVSNFNLDQMKQCMAVRRIDVVQVGYHLFDRRMEIDVLPYCADNGIGVMGYGSLAHGLLAGTFSSTTTFGVDDWRSAGIFFGQPLLRGENLAINVAVVDRLAEEIAAPRGVPVAQVALSWVLHNRAVSTALVGARSPGEVDANLDAVHLVLTPDELSRIDEIMRAAAGRVSEFRPLDNTMEQWGDLIEPSAS
jgi:aryl-alcohol dehydrogenase-like predicted oxidoreductase